MTKGHAIYIGTKCNIRKSNYCLCVCGIQNVTYVNVTIVCVCGINPAHAYSYDCFRKG